MRAVSRSVTSTPKTRLITVRPPTPAFRSFNSSSSSHHRPPPSIRPVPSHGCSYNRLLLRIHRRTMSTSTADVAFSSNTDADEATPRLRALLDNDRWSLTDDKRGLRREFRFKTFKTTWDFMNAVADKCKEERHHPEWTNIYNKVTITWTTHKPEGLSHRDLTMAEFCDEQARERGEIVQSE